MRKVHRGVLNEEERRLLRRMDKISFMPSVPFGLARLGYKYLASRERLMRTLGCCSLLDVVRKFMYHAGRAQVVLIGHVLQVVFKVARMA
jgi:hypothetical protein